MVKVSDGWRAAFPGAHLGVLAMEGVANPERDASLEACKRSIEEELRAAYGGLDKAGLRGLGPMRAYEEYYRRRDKTYHVLAQLESVAVKGKPIPSVAALVEAMFMAELKHMLLTAGHDADAIDGPATLMVSAGGERYTGIRGREETLKAGDMMIADNAGVISSVLYGPDARTKLKPGTRRALFTVYAPAGIGPEAVQAHLADMAAFVMLAAPEATTLELAVLK